MTGHAQQHHKAGQLAENRGQSRSGDAPVEPENKYRIKSYVDNGTRNDAPHGKRRIALEAHLVVQAQRAGHQRRAKEYDAEVFLCVRQDGGRTAKPHGERPQQEKANHHDDQSRHKGIEKARRRHGLSIVMPLRPELAGDVVARPIAKKETECLNNEHHGEHNTHGRNGLGANLSHEISVGHIVQTGNQHTDNRGHSHGSDDPINGSLC